MTDRTADIVTLDLERGSRCGFSEVVFGEGKDVATLVGIFQQLLAAGIPVLATRICADKAAALGDSFPASSFNPVAGTFRIPIAGREPVRQGNVTVVTAGTSDEGVAEEARETLDWMGCHVRTVHDVGVAGPHRLVERLEELQSADAIVVVAGMEGALPSVVGGYVDCPVVAVPTSIGYGANLGGIAALLSMLNSCAANVSVVNIDAGFKGGYVAGLIARRKDKDDQQKS
jgi:NCAIR mutase (PurE)-related protein